MLGNSLAVFSEKYLLSPKGVLTRQPLKLESIVNFLQLRKILILGRRKLCNINRTVIGLSLQPLKGTLVLKIENGF